MQIRKAENYDLEAILNLYQMAREFMAAHGNPGQWGSTYPPVEQVERDIASGNLYVCCDGEKTAAVFYFAPGPDETYHKIYEGEWLDDPPYAVVHRVASPSVIKGAAGFCLDWCFEQFPNLRIDTHQDNLPMQNLLKKKGFRFCGKIFLANGSPRLAFQKK